MSRIVRYTVMCFLIIFIGLLPFSEAYAAGGLELSIISNHNSIEDGGHSFLALTNNTSSAVYVGPYKLAAGKTVYIGARGSEKFPSYVSITGFKGGVFFDYESMNRTVYKKLTKYSISISASSIPAIFEHMKSFGEYNVLTNNCTTFSRTLWNEIALRENKPQCLIVPSNYSDAAVAQPYWLSERLKLLGGETYSELPYTSNNVLLVNPNGKLQPFNWDEMKLKSIKLQDCTSVKLTWKSAKKLIGKDNYNLTGYDILYTSDAGDAKTIRVKSNATSKTINNLKQNTTYYFQIRPVSDYKNNGYVSFGNYSTPKEIRTKCSAKISAKKKTVVLGSSCSLSAKYTCKKHKGKNVKGITWKSSKKKVASVSNGKVKGKGLGTATITCILPSGEKQTCKITVNGTKLKKTALTLYEGENRNLKATTKGKTKKIAWKSNKPSVASVNSKGKVTAHKSGTVTISATANGNTAKCKVVVLKPQIKLDKSTATLSVNESMKLNVIVVGMKKKGIKWSSSDTKVATVKNGEVEAKKAGKTVITAKVKGKQAKCTVTVTDSLSSIDVLSYLGLERYTALDKAQKDAGNNQALCDKVWSCMNSSVVRDINGSTLNGVAVDGGNGLTMYRDTTVTFGGFYKGMSVNEINANVKEKGWTLYDVVNHNSYSLAYYVKGNYCLELYIISSGEISVMTCVTKDYTNKAFGFYLF